MEARMMREGVQTVETTGIDPAHHDSARLGSINVASRAQLSPPSSVPDVLLVDSSPDAGKYESILGSSFRIAATNGVDGARQFLRRNVPAVVVTALEVDGGVELCREV